MTEQQQTIILHDDGDVRLVVGKADGIQQTIQASKTAMRLASPVWKAMFNRVWAEHEASEIPLPDDDIEATLLVLQIAHLKFQDLPKKRQLTLPKLLDLAVICDKYDLVRLVRPFLDLNEWALPWFPVERPDEDCKPELLFIAWTFGYSESFELLAKYFVTHLGAKADGTPLFAGQQLPEHMPPDLLERMLDLRENAITSILEAAYMNLDQVLEGFHCQEDPSSDVECRCMILGSYTSFLIENGFYPQRKEAMDVTVSLQELIDMFATLKLHTYESHDYVAICNWANRVSSDKRASSATIKPQLVERGLTKHEECAEIVNIADESKRICAEIPSPILAEQRIYMSAQAEK